MKIKESLLYKIVRPIISFLFKMLFHPKYEGINNLNKEESYILAGNHTSILDCIFLISATKRNIHFFGKIELSRGLKGIIFKNMDLIFVDRTKKNKDALEKGYEVLNNNYIVGIFPEGTTEKGRGLMEFKMGAVKMAHETNKKIIPFSISGKYKLFSKDLKIVFGNPITIKDDNLDKYNEELRNEVMKSL